jgi:heat-inducible transcriptional repressor
MAEHAKKQMEEDFTQLDQRAKTLLKALIERYIAEGEPIGSRVLSKSSGLDLSAASIRNIMADLEELGLIASPHTSAGRVPTARGYRFFVDQLLRVQPLDTLLNADVVESLLGKTPQQMVSGAAQLLSNLSQFAGVVMIAKRETALAHIEFLRLSTGRILVITVSPEGEVYNRLLLTEKDYSAQQLQAAAKFVNEHYAGVGFEEIRLRMLQEMNQLQSELRQLMEQILKDETILLSESSHMVLSGERHLWDVDEFSKQVDTLKRLFDVFDEKKRLIHLLEESQTAQGVQIYIGGDSQTVPMQELSVVTSAYQMNGKVLGTLGVIGPTRMAYDRVVPIVEITARLLTSALTSTLNTQPTI